jgi:hypothetical protein
VASEAIPVLTFASQYLGQSNQELVARAADLSFSTFRPVLEISVPKSRKPSFLALWCDFSASPARFWALLLVAPAWSLC